MARVLSGRFGRWDLVCLMFLILWNFQVANSIISLIKQLINIFIRSNNFIIEAYQFNLRLERNKLVEKMYTSEANKALISIKKIWDVIGIHQRSIALLLLVFMLVAAALEMLGIA